VAGRRKRRHRVATEKAGAASYQDIHICNLTQIFTDLAKTIETVGLYAYSVMKIFLATIVAIVLCGSAQATSPPEFNTDQFCGGFAQDHGSGNMGDFAKAICELSEESTKTIVDKAWDHVTTDGQAKCLKSSGQSYVTLARCLNTLPAH